MIFSYTGKRKYFSSNIYKKTFVNVEKRKLDTFHLNSHIFVSGSQGKLQNIFVFCAATLILFLPLKLS